MIRLVLSLFFAFSTSPTQWLFSAEPGKQGAVATAHPTASRVGIEMLQQGGNAFDAAVAVQFALAVVYPQAGNITGGGFLVYYHNEDGTGTLDFREKAPLAANRDMYLAENGDVITDLSRDGALAVGVPGSVAGMQAIHQKLGKLPWERLLQPAIELADRGFPLSEFEARTINESQHALRKVNGDAPVPFIREIPFRPGEFLKIPELAETLRNIQKLGADGFYRGPVADAIVSCMERHNGILTHEDLEAYNVVWRQPLSGHYRGHIVYSMGPPSSGGIALIQLLTGSENYDFGAMKPNTSKEAHLMTELMRRVYADRATHLGDADFESIPLKELISPIYLSTRNQSIDLDKATPSAVIQKGNVERIESFETTHFSIVDQWGNAVAITTTLNSRFGSKLYVPEIGCFLNNEMDDFSAKPGAPNQFGLIGSHANAIQPAKRMLSSMSPTIVLKDGHLKYVMGTPGGSTIITNVYQTLINLIDHGMNLQQAVDDRKIHAQWLPDLINFEPGAISPEAQTRLQSMGHKLAPIPQIGRMEAIEIHPDGTLEAVADCSRPGDASAIAY